MKMILKLVIACIICISSIVILYFLFIIVYTSINEYKPAKNIIIDFNTAVNNKLTTEKPFTILTWNIGYAGLGKEMDFFYEGGKMVKPEKEQMTQYLDGITNFLSKNDTLDFILLQEVDFRSSRSYKSNQYSIIRDILNFNFSQEVINYKSAFVPLPLLNPMGKVNAGMAIYSKFIPTSGERIATPSSYPWPKKLFMLQRCFFRTDYQLENGNKLVIFNIHNSAFDDADELRKQELDLIRSIILKEYEQGNYVLVGGDWNQNPPNWILTEKNNYKMKEVWPIPENYLPEDWKWHFHPTLPTNRDVDKPFNINESYCTIIDYFVSSPNINQVSIKTHDLGFENSDHMPVIMSFDLK